jgi:hypothetical protein
LNRHSEQHSKNFGTVAVKCIALLPDEDVDKQGHRVWLLVFQSLGSIHFDRELPSRQRRIAIGILTMPPRGGFGRSVSKFRL